MKSSVTFRSVLALSATLSLAACGKGGDLSITKVKPPVKEAAGTGLTANSSRLYSSKSDVGILALDATAVQSRFFTAGGGPTDIMSILGSLDTRLAEIETRAGESEHTCLDATPSDVTISILGESVTAKFQCYDEIGTGFIAFGKDGDTWWVLDAVGAANTLSKATETDNGTDVEVWGTVGIGNTPLWNSMSYGAYHLKGNSSTKVFEMTAGGVGFGFCGLSMNSNGTDLYIAGSSDSGASCASSDTVCVSTANVSQAGGSCSGLSTFALNKIGRSGQSNWPATGQLTMDGTSSDAIHWASKSAITAASVAKF